MPQWLGGIYRTRAQPEHTITEHALWGLTESVFRGADLVIFDANHKLAPANRWQVFEERTFRNRRSDMPEPREAAVADVTGDGKNDLIVLVHDRILVYPQE